MLCGEHRHCEPAGVGGRDELAAIAHAAQASPDGSLSASASWRDVVPGNVVELGEFAAEQSERAAAMAVGVFLDGDDLVPPCPGGSRSLDRDQQHATMSAEGADCVTTDGDPVKQQGLRRPNRRDTGKE